MLESKLTIRPPEPIPELLERRKGGRLSDRRQPKQQLTAVPAIPLSAEQIRDARKSKGWSQAKLAGTLGVSQQLISHIESGRREPTSEVEAALRSVLKL